jgi:serine/threonine protein kinase
MERPTFPNDASETRDSVAASSATVRYLLGDEIARGGMGVVYRATDTALGREVAIKVLQKKYAPESGTAERFADEARITGQLQHPNIPAVHDLGVLPDGRSFLAMKLIKGQTLAALLGERSDPNADRGRFLAIFEHICQAVAYAHSLGVIHRDLKPSNVMVGKFGEVQVMDWGLAKVLPMGRPAAAKPQRNRQDDGTVIRTRRAGMADTPGGYETPSSPTRVGSVLGTPAYMAQEQAGGEVDRLDSRCDVFGLGAVLCEILTGMPPYTGRDEDQIYRKAMAANQTDAIARLNACGAEPELVALCQRCLAAEPDNRPRDAGEVAATVAELRAAAEERARQAEADQVRTAEHNKRRRMLLVASGTVVVVLLAGLGASLWQMRRAMKAEAASSANADLARAERDTKDVCLAGEQRARQDEAKARQQAFDALRTMTADVVERKFAQGAELTEDDRAFLGGVIAQFDAFAAIKAGDADSQAARAEGRFRVGTIRMRLGELKEAEQDYDQAVTICSQLVADFPFQSDFHQLLARTFTAKGILLSDTGRFDDAVKNFDEALKIRERLAADFPERSEFRDELAGSHNNRGRLLNAMRRPKEAEQDYDRAVSISSQLVADFPARPEFRHDLGKFRIGRAILRRQMGRRNEAEKDYDQAVNLLTQLAADFASRPEIRRDLATCHNNRGVLLSETDRLKEVERDYEQALSLRRRLAGDFPNRPDLRNDLASTCVNLADLHLQNRNWAAAKQVLLEGQPHHLAALKANSRHPEYRLFYRNHLGALIVARAGLLELEDAVRAAETYRDLGWNAPADAYSAACVLSQCVPIVAKHEQLDAQGRKRAAHFYGEAAINLLRDAARKGYKDVAHMKKDACLEPLRQRDDFRTFILELEAK